LKVGLNAWTRFSVRVIAAGSGAGTLELIANGARIYSTTTASLGSSGVRTFLIGNDKQLSTDLFVDNIEARI
jgi:hypothetical protein